MLKHLFILPLIVLLANISSLPAYANDSVYQGDGYHVYPMQNSDVQLVAETITITDNRAFGHSKIQNFGINVDMIFKNHGTDTMVQMGFPVFINEEEGDQIEIDTHFRTWVNGKEVSITKKQGIPNPQIKDLNFSKTVYTYTVSFKSGETKKIKHTYDVGGSFDSMGGWELKYILRTGALWKGVIEDFHMVYKTKISKVNEIIGTLPREQKSELIGDELHLLWNIKNFKPQSDFRLIGGSSRYPLMRRSLSEDMKEIKSYHSIMTSAELRYAKNKVFASYGYPFKNPFVRAQFYYSGSPYKENTTFSEQKMSKEHLEYVEWLSKLEEDKLKTEKF